MEASLKVRSYGHS
jgi:copper chaperone